MRLLAALALSVTAFAQTGGRVEGVVVNSVTGAGVIGVTIRLSETPGTPYHYETVTDGAGSFVFTGITPGEYRTTVEKTGFTPPPPKSIPPPSVRVTAESENNAVRLHFEILPPASIQGHVFGIDDKPAAGVKVDLGGGKIVRTAEDGFYVIDQIQPGVYTLVARTLGMSARLMQDGARVEIVPTYFPSVVDRSLAEQIVIRPGTDRNGYDIRLQTAPVFRVRGVVLDAKGKPAVKAVVELLNKNSTGEPAGFLSYPFGPFSIRSGAGAVAYELEEPAVTDQNGAFEFPSVRTGNWILSAESEDLPPLYGIHPLGVGRNDVDDVQIQLRAPFDVNVSAVLSDNTPAPSNLAVGFDLLPEDGTRGTAVSWRDRKITSVMPGRYRIRATMRILSPDYYVASVRLGDTDVTGQVVDLSPASPPIQAVLRPAAAIRGIVEKGDDAVVILWPQRLTGGDLGMSAVCRPGGVFEIKGLAPGDYYAIALDRFDPREMADVLHLTAFAARAVTVRVEEGSTTDLQLTVTPVTNL